MKTIVMHPIFPSKLGMQVQIPVGARLLAVSLNVHQYYLHVLGDVHAEMETRTIIAFKDDEGMAVPDNIGAYIGNCSQSGQYRRWHFFDQGITPVEQVPFGICTIGDKCFCTSTAKNACGNWRKMRNYEGAEAPGNDK